MSASPCDALLGVVTHDFCCSSDLLYNQVLRCSLNHGFYLRVLMARNNEEQEGVRTNALINGDLHVEPLESMLLAAFADQRNRLPWPEGLLQLLDLAVDYLEQLFVPSNL